MVIPKNQGIENGKYDKRGDWTSKDWKNKKEKTRQELIARYKNNKASHKEIHKAMIELQEKYDSLTDIEREILDRAYEEKGTKNGVDPRAAKSICKMYIEHFVAPQNL